MAPSPLQSGGNPFPPAPPVYLTTSSSFTLLPSKGTRKRKAEGSDSIRSIGFAVDLVRESIRHIARLGVYGALTRDEHEAVGNDGVGVETGRSGSFVGHHGSPHRSSFVDRARKLARSSG